VELISDGGFELMDGSWQHQLIGVDDWWNINNPSGAHGGNRYQYIGRAQDGVTTVNNAEGLLYQAVSIPSNATSVTLSFYVNITTKEVGNTPYDKLFIELRNTSNTLLTTLATNSNVDATGTWVQRTIPITGRAGQTLRITFHGKTDASVETVFRLDDVQVQASVPTVLPPTIETRPATGVASTSATLNGRILSDGGGSVIERRFEWARNPGNWATGTENVDYGVVPNGSISFSGNEFSASLSGLSSDAGYKYRVYARNSAGWSDVNLVNVETFTTTSAPNNAPDKPSNSSPANGATEQTLTLTLQGSTFNDSDGDTHAASQWRVWNSAGTSIVWDSGEDAVNRTSCGVPSGELSFSTSYQWQVRYKDNRGAWSEYSSLTTLTTQSAPLTGYPSATYVGPAASGNFESGRNGNSIAYIVLHTTEGTMSSALSQFQTPNQSSSHYIVGRNGDIWQVVIDQDTAYHLGNLSYNYQSIGIELEGWADGDTSVNPISFGWQSTPQLTSLTNLITWLVTQYSIPKDRSHIIGHNQVPGVPSATGSCGNCAPASQWGGCCNHHDPGAWFNWTRLMANLGRPPSYTAIEVQSATSIRSLPLGGAPVITTASVGSKFVAYDSQAGYYLVFLSGTNAAQQHLSAWESHWDGWIDSGSVSVLANAVQLEVTSVFPNRLLIHSTAGIASAVVARTIDGKRYVATGNTQMTNGYTWREFYIATISPSIATGWAATDYLKVIGGLVAQPDIRIDPTLLNIACDATPSPSPISASIVATSQTESASDSTNKRMTLRTRPASLKPQKTIVDSRFHTNQITVKFRDGLVIRAREGKLEDFGAGVLPRGMRMLSSLAGRWERVDSLSEERIEQMRQTAQRRLGREIADLNLQFNLFLADGIDAAAAIDELNGFDIVELAQPIPKASPPTPPDYQANQGYLNGGLAGVDALGAWSTYYTKGAGIKFADVEFGFNPTHLDLPNVNVIGSLPATSSANTNHGTAVLGEIAAKEDGKGITGIAPECSVYFSSASSDIPSALTAAISSLGVGDVLLIELHIPGPNSTEPPPSQMGYVPVEWYKPAYDRIVTAVGLGITVIEAAGNGYQNLDASVYSDPAVNAGHHPFLPENDSGAIMVGAGEPAQGYGTPRSRSSFSNFGATVDLQGWGRGVWTTGYGSAYSADGEDYYYTSTFDGTSSASPMVAGACVLVQSAFKAKTGIVLSPEDLKRVLRATGSSQQGDTTENIGPQPSIAAAINSIIPTDTAGTFRIYNDGGSTLNIDTLALDQATTWITWSPKAPFDIPAHSYRTVTVFADCSHAPTGQTTRHFTVESNDPDEDPYPDGVTVQVSKPAPPNGPPNRPSNVSPPDGATGQSITLTLQSSTFSDPDGDGHVASQWLVQRASDNATAVDSGEDSSHRTSYPVPSYTLDFGTIYSWQVRYKDDHGNWSGYSSPSSFSTLPPSLTSDRQEAWVVLQWPTNTAGFRLEWSDNLGSSALWNIASPTPTVQIGFNAVTNPIDGGSKFYRLNKP